MGGALVVHQLSTTNNTLPNRFTFSNKNRLPASKVMEKARLQTYSVGDGWVHDQTKNHGANSKKVRAIKLILPSTHNPPQ